MSSIDEFITRREKQNALVLKKGTLNTKRFFNIDGAVYQDSGEEGLSPLVKELMGLTASLVLRCNDCIDYHILQAKKLGATEKQFTETCDIALIVGGSIVIPHLRSAYDSWNQLENRD